MILNERLGGMSRRLNVRAQTNRYLIARRVRAHVHVHVRAARARNTCHVLATSGAHIRGIHLYVRASTRSIREPVNFFLAFLLFLFTLSVSLPLPVLRYGFSRKKRKERGREKRATFINVLFVHLD